MGSNILRFSAALTFVLAVSAPAAAEAQGAYIGGGVGPAVQIDDAPTQFRIELEIGYYFTGRPRGFFLAFSPAQSYGRGWGIFTFPLRLGAMFDLHRSRDFTFQLGPTGTVGFALSNWFDNRRDLDAWFHLSVSFGLRFLVLNERLAIFIRPVEFEFFVGDAYYTDGWDREAIRYVAVAGIHYHF